MVSTKRKKNYEKEEEEKIRNIKTKSKAWKYINKFRRRREEIDKNIKMTKIIKWKDHFVGLLTETERKTITEREEGSG